MNKHKSLVGWRVLVPRGGHWGDRVANSLRKAGAHPVIAPLINFAPSGQSDILISAINQLEQGHFDWITATSATVVDVLTHYKAVIPETTKIAAVGDTTAQAFQAAGYSVSLTPEKENTTYGLLKEWDDITQRDNLKILTLRSDTATPVLTENLIRLGHDVTQVVAFRTVGVPAPERVLEDVSSGKINAVLITSGSVAQQISTQFENFSNDILLACVGPQTKKIAESLGLRVDVVADERTTESLVNAVVAVADTESGD